MDEKVYWDLAGKYRQALERDKKKALKRLWLTVPVGIAVGVAAGILENVWEDFSFPSLWAVIPLFFLAYLTEVAIHEAGHLVCGLLSGYRFVSYRILTFAFYKKEGKLRFGRYAVPGTAGQCLMAPPSFDAEQVPYRLFHMGGVIFDSISFAVHLLLFVFVPVEWLRFYFGLLAFIALVFALSNGIPMTVGVANDGKNLRDMSRSPKAREAACRQLLLLEEMARGTRYKDMPEELFPIYTGENDSHLTASQTHMALQRMMEKGEFAEAKALILRILTETAELPAAYMNAYLFDLWYLEMMGEHRTAIVEMLKNELADFSKRQKNSVQVIRCTLTYQYLYVGNMTEIRAARARLDRLGKSYVFKGDLAFENQLIDNAKAIYDAWAGNRA